MADRYRVAGLYMRALCICIGMICLTWVLVVYLRKPDPAPQAPTATCPHNTTPRFIWVPAYPPYYW
jgi:hypothetical protein